MDYLAEKSKPQFRPKLKTPGILDEVLRTVVFVIIVTVLFDMAVPRSLVDGRSMQPTFQDDERLIVSRLHYLVTRPDRGDIVVFNSVDVGDPDVMLIKRVIGLPGDIIRFTDQQLFVNGIPLSEEYINEQTCNPSSCRDQEIVLQRDEYFAMGDNRNHSRDSRVFGAVPIDHIVGRVVFRYYPFGRIGIIAHQDYDEIPDVD